MTVSLEKTKNLKTPKAQETRERIFKTALEMFKEKGFEKVTMRDIAKNCQMAVGAAYYYFKTKEDLIFDFYLQTQDDHYQESIKVFAETKDAQERIRKVIEIKIEQFIPYRGMLSALFRIAGDPNHRLSPFSEESKKIREEAVDIFRLALEGSNLKIKGEVRTFLPYLFWLYQMGIILFWIHDRSEGQKQTHVLLKHSLKIIFQLIRLSRLPGLKKLRQNILQMLNQVQK